MASRCCPGLYGAGEVLDIDGPTGGYNLTAAFATARLAVASIASALGVKPPPMPKPERSGRRPAHPKRKPKRHWD